MAIVETMTRWSQPYNTCRSRDSFVVVDWRDCSWHDESCEVVVAVDYSWDLCDFLRRMRSFCHSTSAYCYPLGYPSCLFASGSRELDDVDSRWISDNCLWLCNDKLLPNAIKQHWRIGIKISIVYLQQRQESEELQQECQQPCRHCVCQLNSPPLVECLWALPKQSRFHQRHPIRARLSLPLCQLQSHLKWICIDRDMEWEDQKKFFFN